MFKGRTVTTETDTKSDTVDLDNEDESEISDRYSEIDPNPRKKNNKVNNYYGGQPEKVVEPVYHSKFRASGRSKYMKNEGKIIKCWPNGDDVNEPRTILLTSWMQGDLEVIKDAVAERISQQITGPVAKLYTKEGVKINDPKQIEHGGKYIAVRLHDRLREVNYRDNGARNLLTSPRVDQKYLPPISRSQKSSKFSTPDTSHPTSSYGGSENSNNTYTQRYRRNHPKKEEDGVFHAKPVAHKRPSENHKKVDYDKDEGGVFKAKNQNRSTRGAREIEETNETQVDLPIDQREAEIVTEERIVGREKSVKVPVGTELTKMPSEQETDDEESDTPTPPPPEIPTYKPHSFHEYKYPDERDYDLDYRASQRQVNTQTYQPSMDDTYGYPMEVPKQGYVREEPAPQQHKGRKSLSKKRSVTFSPATSRAKLPYESKTYPQRKGFVKPPRRKILVKDSEEADEYDSVTRLEEWQDDKSKNAVAIDSKNQINEKVRKRISDEKISRKNSRPKLKPVTSAKTIKSVRPKSSRPTSTKKIPVKDTKSDVHDTVEDAKGLKDEWPVTSEPKTHSSDDAKNLDSLQVKKESLPTEVDDSKSEIKKEKKSFWFKRNKKKKQEEQIEGPKPVPDNALNSTPSNASEISTDPVEIFNKIKAEKITKLQQNKPKVDEKKVTDRTKSLDRDEATRVMSAEIADHYVPGTSRAQSSGTSRPTASSLDSKKDYLKEGTSSNDPDLDDLGNNLHIPDKAGHKKKKYMNKATPTQEESFVKPLAQEDLSKADEALEIKDTDPSLPLSEGQKEKGPPLNKDPKQRPFFKKLKTMFFGKSNNKNNTNTTSTPSASHSDTVDVTNLEDDSARDRGRANKNDNSRNNLPSQRNNNRQPASRRNDGSRNRQNSYNSKQSSRQNENDQEKKDEVEAAIRIQSQFRGYQTRKRLQHNGEQNGYPSRTPTPPQHPKPQQSRNNRSTSKPVTKPTRHITQENNQKNAPSPTKKVPPKKNAPPAKKEVPPKKDAPKNGPSRNSRSEKKTGNNVKKSYDDHEVKAATRIQAGFRGYKTRRELKNGRNNSDWDEEEKRQEEHAATKIQASFRGHKVRKELNNAEKNYSEQEAKAAVKIQSSFRGYKTRKDLAEKESEDFYTEQEHHAAVKIQSGYRGFKTRKDLALKNSSEYLKNSESEADGYAEKYYTDEEHQAAIKIQTGMRGVLARKELARRQAQKLYKSTERNANDQYDELNRETDS